MKRGITLAVVVLLLGRWNQVQAQDFAQIDYLACDWGPAMTLPGKTNEPPRFSETEEEVYFLKQLTRLRRVAGSFRGQGTSIYLCKMKADGSAKTEIKELWRDVAYPIDTQGQTTWLDVNEQTRRIAVAIGFAGSDLVGLWVLKMDGGDLRQIVSARTESNQLRAINTCCWTPDGQWIYFEEEWRGTNPNRRNIARCDTKGDRLHRLLVSDGKQQYRQPSVAPDGSEVAFTKYPDGYPGQRWVWLMDPDGGKARPLGGKQSMQTWGSYPTWSPDGKQILYTGAVGMLADVASGKVVWQGAPKRDGKAHSWGWAKWGHQGMVGYNLTGLLLTDSLLEKQVMLGASRLVECKGGTALCNW